MPIHKLKPCERVTMEHPKVYPLYLIVPHSFGLSDTHFIVVLIYFTTCLQKSWNYFFYRNGTALLPNFHMTLSCWMHA